MPEEAFVVHLTRTYKLAGIPVSAFYHNQMNYNVFRLCFAKTNETLEKAASILCNI
jgi:methionine aminotransferase